MKPNFNNSLFLTENFDPNTFLNEAFLYKLDFKDLSSFSYPALQQDFQNLQTQLIEIKERFTEELETCLLVNEINAETRVNEQGAILQEYEELASLSLELEYSLTRTSEGTLHQENSILFLEKEKLQDSFTKELLETFLEVNRGEEDKLESFSFEKQALFLYILMKVSSNLNEGKEYEKGRNRVFHKYEDFKGKLMLQFKDAFWRYDPQKLALLTPLLEKYGLLPDASLFYIETSLQDIKAFKIIMDPHDFEGNTKLFLETLHSILRALKRLFERRELAIEDHKEYQLKEVFGEKSPEIVKQVFSFVYERFLHKGFELFLEPNRKDKEIYLKYLEFLMGSLKFFSEEVSEIESPIIIQIKELNLNYSSSLYEEIRSGFYELELSDLQEKLDENVHNVLISFENAEKNGKKTKELPNNKLEAKEKLFSWNSLLFQDQKPIKKNKKISKNERIKKLAVLKDPFLHESIENCFIRLQEACRRVLLISKDLNKTINIYGLLDVFLNSFGKGLLEPLIGFTEDLIPGLNSSKPLEEDFFEVTSRLNVYIQRMDLVYLNCTKTLILINESQEFVNKKEGILQRMTILLHRSMQSALASIFIHSNKLLFEKQKKKDFISEAHNKTEACIEFIKYLGRYVKIIKLFAFDKTKINLLSSLGTQIITMLGEHFVHYKVNNKGSGSLMADLNEYCDFIKEFEDENLLREWEAFTDIAKVLTIPNEKVSEYIKEKNIEKKELLNKYLKNR